MTALKHFISITCIGVLSTLFVWAQEDRQQQFERIESEKKAYISKSLNLTPSEAQKFFPLYDQYHAELTTLQRARRKERTQNQKLPGQTTLQHQRLQRNTLSPDRDILAFDAKKLELKKNYRKRFADIIGQARASEFFQVEEEFHDYLIHQLQNRRRGERNP